MELCNIYEKFPTEKSCIELLELIAWRGKPQCPYCGVKYNSSYANDKRYKCNTCNMSFSVTVKTFLHKTKCDFQKWFYLISLINSRQKIPSLRKLSEDLSITKDTVARMLHKLKSTNQVDINIISSLSSYLL